MKNLTYLFTLICLSFSLVSCANSSTEKEKNAITQITEEQVMTDIVVGAQQFDAYLPLLQGKRVAMVVNQTSAVKEGHLVDVLLQKGVNVTKVFAPEHGFRGKADAGEKVNNGIDKRTGLPIVSLYGKNKKPSATQLQNVDIVLFDIQDVGARFYTYISTLQYVMKACAEQGKQVLVLDRPNPNGHYVDGPVLKDGYQSFVGMQKIPVVHGMTVAEYAKYLNGENLLKNGVKANLTVIPCLNYTHNTRYELPIAPSPNLPNAQAIALYPTLCLFEGTTISVGRGTNNQFQLFGHPKFEQTEFVFMPVSMEGAKYPKHENKLCNGVDLSTVPVANMLDLNYLVETYNYFKANNVQFFNNNNFFNKLAGYNLQAQIEAGMNEYDIRASWQEDIDKFKHIRKYYLLYPDFE